MPHDTSLPVIALRLERSDLAPERLTRGKTWRHTTALQDTALHCRHLQPARMVGRGGAFQPVQNPPRLAGGKGSRARTRRMRIQVVLPHADLLSIGIAL